jgi:hypothetical protein
MEEAAAIRRAALDAVGDVEPVGLRERIGSLLESSSMVPGVLTLLTVETVADTTSTSLARDSGSLDQVAQRGAGVQLIYDGLRLTRQLAQTEPWTDVDSDDADLDVLVADVLVARGFFLLARTDASETAVETVRAFGRDQTVRRTADDPALDRNLEADVLELAAVAGSTADSGGTTAQFREYAAELAATVETPTDGFHSPDAFFPTNVRDRLRTLATESPGSEGVTPSVDD